MSKYPIGLLRSRLLSAIGDLENISGSDCPSYYEMIKDPCKHLKARIGDAVQMVCNQYGMDHHAITEQLMVEEQSEDETLNGHLLIHLRNDPENFVVLIPLEQLEHWFGAKP